MKKRFESKVKPDICPKCGAPVYRIFYGMPMMSEEEYFNTYHEHVIYPKFPNITIHKSNHVYFETNLNNYHNFDHEFE